MSSAMSDRIAWYLEKAGCKRLLVQENEIVCTCPYHDDLQGSWQYSIPRRTFSVNTNTGAFVCFAASCNAKGLFANFLRDKVGIPQKDIQQVLEMLGREDGRDFSQLPEWSNRLAREVDATQGNSLLIQHNTYRQCYLAMEKQNPDHYLWHTRGFKEETLEAWEIGWSPKAEAYTFGCRDTQGRVVGFSFRSEKRGYIHRFRKSRHLYGAHKVDGTKEVWLCEGALDALALWQMSRGAICPVATLGTPVSRAQMDLLTDWIQTHDEMALVLAFDRDEGGRRATQRVLDYLSVSAGKDAMRNVFVQDANVSETKDHAEFMQKKDGTVSRYLFTKDRFRV